jgi:hypothetical protein
MGKNRVKSPCESVKRSVGETETSSSEVKNIRRIEDEIKPRAGEPLIPAPRLTSGLLLPMLETYGQRGTEFRNHIIDPRKECCF